MDTMHITVFGKIRKTNDGRSFTSYTARLTNRNGETMSVGVKFKMPCQGPAKDDCPVNISFEKKHANLQERYDSDADKVYRTLWIDAYTLGEPYEDHSLDDF